MGPFFKAHYLTLVREIFAVMTDTMHKPGFKLQAKILATLLHVVKANLIPVPLWDESEGPTAYASNAAFVQVHMVNLLASSFPNLSSTQVEKIVSDMFVHVDDFATFKNHLRDFLIQTKEFGRGDNAELFSDERREAEQLRQAQVPGLLPPNMVNYEGMEA